MVRQPNVVGDGTTRRCCRIIPRTPYVSEKGLQAVIDFIRQRNPQTPAARVPTMPGLSFTIDRVVMSDAAS